MIDLPQKTLDMKTAKYQHLINNITTREWTVAPLVVLVAGDRASTHIPSMKSLETKPELLVTKMKINRLYLNKSTQLPHTMHTP
jgi:hypothetical protein